jgi:lysozyme
MSTIKGIDVSHYQGVIDFEKVKASGMSFVFAKASQGTAYVDNMFNTNYEKAKKAGLKFGAYHYGTFSTVAEAQVEAKHFLAVLKDKVLTYPAVLDIEENKKGVGRTQLTDASIAFLEVLECAGYFAMIYSGKYFFESYLYPDKLAPYAQWIARYGVADLGRKAGIWQYASDGKVNGVIGNCDMNYAYADYSFTSP